MKFSQLEITWKYMGMSVMSAAFAYEFEFEFCQ